MSTADRQRNQPTMLFYSNQFLCANPHILRYFKKLVEQQRITSAEGMIMMAAITPLVINKPQIRETAFAAYMSAADNSSDFAQAIFGDLCRAYSKNKKKPALKYITACNNLFMSFLPLRGNHFHVTRTIAGIWFGLIALLWDHENGIMFD